MIDSHCHLADEAFSDDVGGVVDRARAAGVEQALCILDATSDIECARAEQVASLWGALRFAVGVHPHQAERFAKTPDDVGVAVTEVCKRHNRVCAIGEIGPFFPKKTSKKSECKVLRKDLCDNRKERH